MIFKEVFVIGHTDSSLIHSPSNVQLYKIPHVLFPPPPPPPPVINETVSDDTQGRIHTKEDSSH